MDTDTVTVEQYDGEGQLVNVYQGEEYDGVGVIAICSWGRFAETGTDSATNHWALTWETGGEPPQSTVTFTVVMFDYVWMPPGDFGSRDDSDLTTQMTVDVRYPGSIEVSHRLHDPNTDPPLDFGGFGYYNIIKVFDNRGNPFEYVGATQFRADPSLSRRTHLTNPTVSNWQLDLQTTMTDENGELKDLVQGVDRMELENDPEHEYKRVITYPTPPTLEKRYWNPSPFPTCNASHVAGSYESIP